MSRGWIPITFAVVVAYGCGGDYDNDEDLDETVISCEEASARLADCCPGYQLNVRCIHNDTRHTYEGCDGSKRVETAHKRPSLTMQQSVCIRGTSCSTLVPLCDRLAGRHTPSDGNPTSLPVCL